MQMAANNSLTCTYVHIIGFLVSKLNLNLDERKQIELAVFSKPPLGQYPSGIQYKSIGQSQYLLADG